MATTSPWAGLTALVFLAAAGLGGCASAPVAGERAEPPPLPSAGGTVLTVIDRGWHTDIALPVDAFSGPIATLGQAFPGARVLVFGFGDRAYYMAPGAPFLAMLAALFPSPGVILVTALDTSPAEAFGSDHVVPLVLSPEQRQAITGTLWRSLDEQADGSIRRLGDGPYPGSGFYASGDIYDAFHNCNRWTLSTLRRGGLPADPDGVVSAAEVMAQVRRMAAQPHLPPSP